MVVGEELGLNHVSMFLYHLRERDGGPGQVQGVARFINGLTESAERVAPETDTSS